MKNLLLLRHAKSSWEDNSLADFDRPLAPRGLSAAKLIGHELAERGWLPGHALVSPAKRTRETWDLVAAQLVDAPTAEFAETLYDATAERILAELRQTRESVKTLIVVGHNPGTENLALQLADDESDTDALARLGDKFPTAALARFEFGGLWRELGPAAARLTHFLRPKDLD